MVTICLCYSLLIIALVTAPIIRKLSIPIEFKYLWNLLFVIFIIIIAAYRTPGCDPDYFSYVSNYNNGIYGREIETSFKLIARLGHRYDFSSIFLFVFYASLSIVLKYTAIQKYSICIPYSICVWLSFSYILHDLIQIRVSVAIGLFLLFIPNVINKQYFKSILLLCTGFFFHSSAILMGIVYFMRSKKINKYFWIIVYIFSWLINLNLINIYSLIQRIWSYLPYFISARTGDTTANLNRLADLNHINIYALYILVPSIIAIILLFNAKKLNVIYPYSIVLIKIMFIGIFIFSIGLPIISVRCFEFLSVSLIYSAPLLLYCIKGKLGILIGEVIISVFCILNALNLIYKQEVLFPV